MNKAAWVCALAALALVLPTAAVAQGESGQVQEVLIKVRTDEGDKWFRLGESLEPADVRPGHYIEFDYADDTIETISTPGSEDDASSETDDEKKQ
jgi:hypothetical protein